MKTPIRNEHFMCVLRAIIGGYSIVLIFMYFLSKIHCGGNFAVFFDLLAGRFTLPSLGYIIGLIIVLTQVNWIKWSKILNVFIIILISTIAIRGWICFTTYVNIYYNSQSPQYTILAPMGLEEKEIIRRY